MDISRRCERSRESAKKARRLGGQGQKAARRECTSARSHRPLPVGGQCRAPPRKNKMEGCGAAAGALLATPGSAGQPGHGPTPGGPRLPAAHGRDVQLNARAHNRNPRDESRAPLCGPCSKGSHSAGPRDHSRPFFACLPPAPRWATLRPPPARFCRMKNPGYGADATPRLSLFYLRAASVLNLGEIINYKFVCTG